MLYTAKLLVQGSPQFQHCCCSVAQTCIFVCDPMDCSTPGLPVPYHPLEFAQVHVHWISDAIQPSHPPTSSSLSALNLSHHQELPVSQLLASGDQNTGASASASVFPMNIQGRFPLGLTGLISLLYKGLSDVFSSTTLQRHQFFGTLPSWRSALKTVCVYWEDHSLDNMDLCWQSDVSTLQHTV